MTSIADNSFCWDCTYNANGMRVSRTNGTDTYTYVYNGGQLVSMTKNTDTLYFSYDAGGVMSVTHNGTVYQYVTNIQGDVVAIISADTGIVVVEYTYDAWGNPLAITGSMKDTLGTLNPLRYRGYVYDQETGLYYLQSRYYSPNMGRFINADVYASTGQGFLGTNMFAYCLNNPVKLCDENGMHSDSYAGDAGEKIGIFLYELLTGEDHPSRQAQQLENEVIKTQIDMMAVGAAAAWDAYMRGYNIQQNSQMLEAQLTLDGAKTIYNYLDKTGTISGVKYGYHTVQAASEGKKALAYLSAPIPSPIDEFWAIGHAVKGIYHLLMAGLEALQ